MELAPELLLDDLRGDVGVAHQRRLAVHVQRHEGDGSEGSGKPIGRKHPISPVGDPAPAVLVG